MYFYDEDERLWSLPTFWTSLGAVDPFVVLSGGRALFRPRDLLRLSELIAGLELRTGKEVPCERRQV